MSTPITPVTHSYVDDNSYRDKILKALSTLVAIATIIAVLFIVELIGLTIAAKKADDRVNDRYKVIEQHLAQIETNTAQIEVNTSPKK